MIGTSRRADIRVRHSSVRRRHAYFQLTPEGLSIRAHAGASLRDRRGRQAKSLLVKDGDQLGLGEVRLMLVLTESAPQAPAEPRDPDDDWFETDPDVLFETQPVLRRTKN